MKNKVKDWIVDEALNTPQLEMRREVVLRAALKIKAKKTVEPSSGVSNVQNTHQQCAEQLLERLPDRVKRTLTTEVRGLCREEGEVTQGQPADETAMA